MKMVKRSIFSEKDPEDDIGEPQNEDQDMMTQPKDDKQPKAEPIQTRKRDRPNGLRGSSPESPQKKMKTDPEAELSTLLAASQKPQGTTQSQVDHKQKQLIYKIVGQIKSSQNTCDVTAVWKRFMSMSDRETCRPGSHEPLINNKDELRSVLEALEVDNLVMFAAEDDKVVLV